MGEVLVENAVNHVTPHKKPLPSTLPAIENFDGVPTEGGDDYATLKKLQRQLEYVLGCCWKKTGRDEGINERQLQIHPAARGIHQG